VFLKNLWSAIKPSRRTDAIETLDQKLVFNVHKKFFPRMRQMKYARLFLSLSEKIWLGIGIALFIIGFSWWSSQFAGSHRIDTPATGGTYREGIIGSPQHFNPLYASLSAVDAAVSKLVFSGIMRYDNNGQLINDIAESVEINENKTTYTIKLKNNVTFHDNTPLTAHDVAFTISLIQNEEVKSPSKGQFFNVKTEVIDDHNMTLTLQEPFEHFQHTLIFGILAKHIWAETEPTQINQSTLNITPIGSGPYVFSELSTNESEGISTVRLVRNENYHRQPAHIETIEIKSASTKAQILDLFLKQEIDGLGALTGEEIKRLGDKRANQYIFAAPEYTGIFFNQLLNVSLKRQSVRNALSLAINKQHIIDDILTGRAQVAHTPFIEGMAGYIKGEHTTNIEQAITELDEDNWERISSEEFLNAQVDLELERWVEDFKTENAENEERESADPTEEETEAARGEITTQIGATLDTLQPYFRKRNNNYLEINLSHVATDDAQAIAEELKAAWRSLGVHVTLSPIPAQLLERETLKSHAYEALLVGVVLGSNPDPYPLWYDAGNENRTTLARFIDRNLDDLLEAARNTKDKSKREKLYEQFQEFILNKKPAIVLYNPTYQYAVHSRVLGVTQGRIVTPVDRFADIENWFIKSKKQWQW